MGSFLLTAVPSVRYLVHFFEKHIQHKYNVAYSSNITILNIASRGANRYNADFIGAQFTSYKQPPPRQINWTHVFVHCYMNMHSKSSWIFQIMIPIRFGSPMKILKYTTYQLMYNGINRKNCKQNGYVWLRQKFERICFHSNIPWPRQWWYMRWHIPEHCLKKNPLKPLTTYGHSYRAKQTYRWGW